MNKLVIIIITIAVIVGGGAFYGGMKYTESKSPQGGFSRADFQNLSPEERQQRFQGLGANVSGAFTGNHEGGSGFRDGRFGSGVDGSPPLIGEVISQSNDSLTIKLNDGSTKIIFVSNNTQITKSIDGTIDDLNKGEQIFIGGTENPDGSYTAQTIQLSPANHGQ